MFLFLKFILYLTVLVVLTTSVNSDTSNPCTDSSSPKPCPTEDLFNILPMYSHRQKAATTRSPKVKFKTTTRKYGFSAPTGKARKLNLSYKNGRARKNPRPVTPSSVPRCEYCPYSEDQIQPRKPWDPFGSLAYLFNYRENQTSRTQESGNEKRSEESKLERPRQGKARKEMKKFESQYQDSDEPDSEESSTLKSDKKSFFDSDDLDETTRKTDSDGDSETTPEYSRGSLKSVYVSNSKPENVSHDLPNSHIKHSKTKYQVKLKSTNGTFQQTHKAKATTAKVKKFRRKSTTSTEANFELLDESTSTTSSPNADTDARYEKASFEKGYQESHMDYREKSLPKSARKKKSDKLAGE